MDPDDAATTVRWDFESADRSYAVYDGRSVNGDLRDRCSVERDDSGRRDLIIRRVQLSDAGVYSCFEERQSAAYSARLVVVLRAFLLLCLTRVN